MFINNFSHIEGSSAESPVSQENGNQELLGEEAKDQRISFEKRRPSDKQEKSRVRIRDNEGILRNATSPPSTMSRNDNGQSINQSIGQSVNRSVSQLVGRSIYLKIVCREKQIIVDSQFIYMPIKILSFTF